MRLLFLLLLSFWTHALLAEIATENSASLNVGLSLSAISGSKSILGLRDGLNGIENVSAEKFPLPIGEGWRMGLRAVRLVALELPIDYLMMLFQHEFFGHGARCREFGGSANFNYTSPPPPYGIGHASSSCTHNSAMESHVGILGGVTANDVMRNDMAMTFVKRRTIAGPSAFLYQLSAGQTSGYLWFGDQLLKAHYGSEQAKRQGDMGNYLTHINLFYGRDVLSMKSLKLLSLVNILDPFLFNSLYGVYHYVRYGEDAPTWMIPFGDHIKYLPAAAMSLTPFGPDIGLRNYFSIFDRAVVATFSLGFLDDNTYWNASVQGEAWRNQWLSVGGHLEIFRQPNILLDANYRIREIGKENGHPKYEVYGAEPAFGRHQWGVLATVSSSFRFFDPFSLELELGGKSKGYVPGEEINAGFILRSGVTVYF